LETVISAEGNGLRVHSSRATAATNALSNESDIAKTACLAGRYIFYVKRILSF
jgi:hypothetical protein